MSVYTVFFFVALYSIFRKGLRSTGSIVMLLVVLYLYASSLALWAISVARWFLIAYAYLPPNASDLERITAPLLDRHDTAAAAIVTLGTPAEALFMFNMIIGDSVVIWRVWALYRRSLWVVAIPSVMLLLSLIFNIIDLVCLTGSGFSSTSTVAGGGPVCANAELISWALSLGTNAACTTAIWLKAWNHRRTMRVLNAAPSLSSSRMSVDRVLSLLVESGCIYCLFWLTQIILFLPISRFNASVYVFDIFGAMGDQISGLYPTLIIVIVNLQHTMWREGTYAVGSRSGRNGSGTLLRAPNSPGLGRSAGTGTASTVRWGYPKSLDGPRSTVTAGGEQEQEQEFALEGVSPTSERKQQSFA